MFADAEKKEDRRGPLTGGKPKGWVLKGGKSKNILKGGHKQRSVVSGFTSTSIIKQTRRSIRRKLGVNAAAARRGEKFSTRKRDQKEEDVRRRSPHQGKRLPVPAYPRTLRRKRHQLESNQEKNHWVKGGSYPRRLREKS